jgi:hypothetical protein
MSSAALPEFFFDRSLGKITATRLRDAGYTVHLIADFYEADATKIPDEQWITEGCRRGWRGPGFWRVYGDGTIRRMWP